MIDAKTIEIDPLIPVMIKLVASHNPDIKAQACQFITRAANEGGHSEVAILIVNILNKDLSDANPSVRSMAVSTICSIAALAENHAINGRLPDTHRLDCLNIIETLLQPFKRP